MIFIPDKNCTFKQMLAFASIIPLVANCSPANSGMHSDATRRQENAYTDCPIDRVIYTQSDAPDVIAGFAKQKVRSNFASDLVFFVQRGSDRFWFGFSSPNGYAGTYIHPQIDPKQVKQSNTDEAPDDRLPAMIVEDEEQADETSYDRQRMNFDAFKSDLTIFAGPPQSTDPSPAFIFARELGPHFYYVGNNDLYQLTAPVDINIELWRPTACDKTAH